MTKDFGKIKINMTTIIMKTLLIINFISCIRIPCLDYYFENMTIVYAVINLISFILILIIRPKIKIGGFFLYVFLYYFILVFSTLINNGNKMQLFAEALVSLTTISIWNSLDKKEIKKYFGVLAFVIEVLTFLNLFIIIKFPDGLYYINYSRNYYLFDHVNVSIRYLLPGCCFTLIRIYMQSNKIDIRTKIYIFSVVLTLLLTWPVTAIIGMVVFLLGWKFMYFGKYAQSLLLPIKTITTTAIVSFLLVAVKIQNLFSNFIVNVLKRDITLTGRTIIWDTAIEYIKQQPLFGMGRLATEVRRDYLGVTSAHNQFLNFMFEGGIILMALIFIMVKEASKRVKECKNFNIVIVISATVLAYAVMWITEPFSYSGTSLMFLVWLFAYRSSQLFEELNVEENR